jgi:hypothetical protein
MVEVGSEWTRVLDGHHVVVVATIPALGLVQFRGARSRRTRPYWLGVGEFVRRYDPAPARDLDQRGGDDGGEHASNVRADGDPGECGS